MIHIPGKRKIVSGVDALSRGDTIKGIIQGISILTCFPFHLVANQRSEALVPWLDLCWMGGNSLPHLSAGGWFDQDFTWGRVLWTPPLAAAKVAVEQLCRNNHLREKNLYIVYLPCLMLFMWRNQLSKVAGLIETLPFDEVLWHHINHERLILLLFSLLRIVDLGSYREPNSWLTVKGNYKRDEKRRKAWEGVVCAHFWSQRGHWKSFQWIWYGRCYYAVVEESLPLTKPQEEEGFDLTQSEDALRHLSARNGDHLLVPL